MTPHLLILDDEPSLTMVISYMLQGMGWRVSVTNDPKEALTLLCTDGVDMFLTDYRMPQCNGLAVIEELRQLPSNMRGWRQMRGAELHTAYRRSARALRRAVPRTLPRPRIVVPPRVWLWLDRWNPFSHSLTWSRQSLARFWGDCLTHWRRGQIERIQISGIVFNALQEVTLFSMFAALFFSRLLHRLVARTGLADAPTPR